MDGFLAQKVKVLPTFSTATVNSLASWQGHGSRQLTSSQWMLVTNIMILYFHLDLVWLQTLSNIEYKTFSFVALKLSIAELLVNVYLSNIAIMRFNTRLETCCMVPWQFSSINMSFYLDFEELHFERMMWYVLCRTSFVVSSRAWLITWYPY
jgi:hypothetical protein